VQPAPAGKLHFELPVIRHWGTRLILCCEHYKFLILPTERRKARRPIFIRKSNRYAEPTAFGEDA